MLGRLEERRRDGVGEMQSIGGVAPGQIHSVVASPVLRLRNSTYYKVKLVLF
jgi:hypothetical protein